MDRRAFGHLVATCCDILGVGGSKFTNFKLAPTILTCRKTSKQSGQTGATSNAQQCRHRIAGALHYVETLCEDIEEKSNKISSGLQLFLGTSGDLVPKKLWFHMVKTSLALLSVYLWLQMCSSQDPLQNQAERPMAVSRDGE